MIRRALRRPLMSSMTALAATAAVAGGFTLTGQDSSEAATSSTASTALAVHPTSLSSPEPTLADPRPLAAKKRLELAAAAHRAELAKAAKIKKARAKALRERKAAEERASRAAERKRLLSADPKSVARALLGDYGFSSSQFGCLDSLWTRESGWSTHATNASSGAYGIPQALPGAKMASAGSDWRDNPATQIRWGLQYIRASYGSPCSAWAHSQANGWY